MLVYLSAGERNYDQQNMKPWSRPFWEIEVVVEGRISLYVENGPIAPRRQTMWVLPPGHIHAWRGDHFQTAQIIVFHFDDFPSPVNEWILRKGWLELKLDAAALQQIKDLYRRAEKEWHKPSVIRTIVWQQLAIEFALLIARLEHPAGDEWNKHQPGVRVQQAMRLFVQHLKESWNVEQVCQAMGVSPAHLRRMFHQVLHTSPRAMFETLRLNRAKELMMIPGSKLEDVAQDCGYENSAVLSRAFKRHYRIAPSQWRGQRD